MAAETDQQKKKSAAPVTLESKVVAEEDLENYQLICGAIQDI